VDSDGESLSWAASPRHADLADDASFPATGALRARASPTPRRCPRPPEQPQGVLARMRTSGSAGPQSARRGARVAGALPASRAPTTASQPGARPCSAA